MSGHHHRTFEYGCCRSRRGFDVSTEEVIELGKFKNTSESNLYNTQLAQAYFWGIDLADCALIRPWNWLIVKWVLMELLAISFVSLLFRQSSRLV